MYAYIHIYIHTYIYIYTYIWAYIYRQIHAHICMLAANEEGMLTAPCSACAAPVSVIWIVFFGSVSEVQTGLFQETLNPNPKPYPKDSYLFPKKPGQLAENIKGS